MLPSFHNPVALLWLLLGVPVVLLYLHGQRIPRTAISTGWLWARILPANDRPSWWRRRRRAISATIQLGILTLLVLALAEPCFGPPRQVVLVIDNTGGMGSARPPDRLNRAKRLAEDCLTGLGNRDQAAIVCTAGALRVRCGLTGSRQLLAEAIQSIHAASESACTLEAVRLARRVLDGQPRGSIVVFADPDSETPADLAGASDVAWGRASHSPVAAVGRGLPPWSALAVVAFAALAAEWCFFHRRRTE